MAPSQEFKASQANIARLSHTEGGMEEERKRERAIREEAGREREYRS